MMEHLFPPNRHWPVILLLLLLFFTVIQFNSLDVFARDYDEGVYLAEAHLLYAGHDLYTEIKSPLLPPFLWGLATLFALAGGPSVVAARLGIIAMGALGLVAMAWCGQRLAPPGHGAATGMAAALLLLLLPRWLFYGQIAMADIPSLSLSLVAVAVALVGWQEERARRFFFLGGLVAGLAFGVKQLAAYTAPLLALIVLLSYRPQRPFTPTRFFLDGLATLGGFLLSILLPVAFVDIQGAYQQAFLFHLGVANTWVDPLNALRLIGVFHWEHLGWTLLALLGLFVLAQRRAWRTIGLLLGWEALVIVLLSQNAPLWGHLMLPLVSPVILAGALALVEGTTLLLNRQPRALPIALAAALFVLLWPLSLRADQATLSPPAQGSVLQNEIIPWLRATVPPTDRLLTDDQIIAVRVGRLVPHDMTDTSFTKIHSGFLSAQELITATERDRPAAIIFWSNRFNSLPEWRQWVEQHYRVGRQLSSEQVIFLRPDLAPPSDPLP